MAGPAINAALGAAMDPNNAHAGVRAGCAGGLAGMPPAIHFGVTCDKSGMSPIVGPRFHVPDADYDLCEAEYNKLPEAERLTFVKIERPGASWIRPDAWAQDEAPAAAAATATETKVKTEAEAETAPAPAAPDAAAAANDDETEEALLAAALAASLAPPTDEVEAAVEEEKAGEVEASSPKAAPNATEATEEADTNADADGADADAGSEASWTAVEAQTDADADAAAATQADEVEQAQAQAQAQTETTGFDEQLAELARMGFDDRDSNIALLKRYQGRLDRVINFLLELGEGRV